MKIFNLIDKEVDRNHSQPQASYVLLGRVHRVPMKTSKRETYIDGFKHEVLHVS
jgi:hypothetical protein